MMTVNITGGTGELAGIRAELQALSTKQRIAIIAAIAIALILEVLGLSRSCLGFLIIAVVLYMIPHMMKVMSPKIKAMTCLVFIVVSLLVGVFAYTSVPDDYRATIDSENDWVRNMGIEGSDGTYTVSFEVNPSNADAGDGWGVKIRQSDIGMVSFGSIVSATGDAYNKILTQSELVSVGDGWYSGSTVLSIPDGKFEVITVLLEKAEGDGYKDTGKGLGFTYDSGISFGDTLLLCFKGSGYTILLTSILFFIILGFSTMMRRSADKTRAKMEADGRLYPKGYGLCKSCGTVVLPGEVTCRKCGAYIDVPEEMKSKKKDYFTCSVCGAEVPSDADECPKCGAKFDEDVEVEVQHPDGTVDVSDEVVPCPHCGEDVPSNADWCPKCGKKIKG